MIMREELGQRRGAPQIVGHAEALRRVQVALHRAAETDTTVLLEGESGTGKELFARAIHDQSDRRDAPFGIMLDHMPLVNAGTPALTVLRGGRNAGSVPNQGVTRPENQRMATMLDRRWLRY